MQVYLPSGEGRRLASLLAAVATLLLLLFTLAVALPLLPPRLADPFWQLAFSGALCSNGVLALLAVLLLQLAAVLDPEAGWLQCCRQRLAGLCRWVAFGFVLVIPLQGWAAWQAFERAGAIESRGARQELARIAQFRQAVVNANSVAALQANLAAIQAPPLGREDQVQSLPTLKASLLSQLDAAEQRAKARQAPASAAMPTEQASSAGRLTALLKDSLRTLLLSLGLALGFAAAAQRKGSGLSLLDEWRLAIAAARRATLGWRDAWNQRQTQRRTSRELQTRSRREQNGQAASAALRDEAPRSSERGPRGGPDAEYFNSLAASQEDSPPP